MKKLSVRLSLLCLLAILLVPFAGCKKEETDEETPATTTDTTTSTSMSTETSTTYGHHRHRHGHDVHGHRHGHGHRHDHVLADGLRHHPAAGWQVSRVADWI